MVYHIEEMSESAKDGAKRQLQLQMQKSVGFGLESVPNILGVGITRGAIVVTVLDDGRSEKIAADTLPTELHDSYEGLPVLIETSGPLYTLQGQRGGGGGGRILEGNISIYCKEQGTVFAILEGVNNPSDKYLVSSSHVIQGTNCGGIGKFAHDGRPCNVKTAYLDAASVLLNKNVQSSPNIRGLGQPKGFAKPTVGMKLHQGGTTSGHVDSEITQINFDSMSNTNQQGNCPVKLIDMFIASRCGRPGDSGSAIYNDGGYLVGICTFGSNPQMELVFTDLTYL